MAHMAQQTAGQTASRENKAAIAAELARPARGYAMPDLATLRELQRQRARELLGEMAQTALTPEDKLDAEYLAEIGRVRLEWRQEDGHWRLELVDLSGDRAPRAPGDSA